MITKREILNNFRIKIKELNADSVYTNKQLYSFLIEQAQWLIKREISSGRIYRNTSFFQTLKCQEVIEVPAIDKCCPIETDCVIYRTKEKIPEAWVDNKGPIIRSITSIDNSTRFIIIEPINWLAKRNNPYEKMFKEKYTFFSDGYFYFPEYNPRSVNITGFFKDDISELNGCEDNKNCVLYLDTIFPVPDWLHAEMFAKAMQMISTSKQMQEEQQIDKNPNRSN